jgi:selenide,water dikinase
VPQAKLLEYLEGISNDLRPNETPGMDCALVATRHPGLWSISTTDFFYPNVENPFAQGRIAACNVLSDLYANGVRDVDTVLMILATSLDMEEAHRDICTKEMIRGFTEAVREAGASVTGGQTVKNPWPIIGGVASSVVREEDILRPDGAAAGDVLVLTKPLGTQVAANLWQWRGEVTPNGVRNWPKVASFVTEEAAARVFDIAVDSMARLNRNAAAAMHRHGARAATDVTGFGLLGHAQNLAEHSAARVSIIIDALPIIAQCAKVDELTGGGFRVTQGLSAETSGGLLVALPSRAAALAFIDDVASSDNRPAWIIGRVVETAPGEKNSAMIRPDAAIIEAGLEIH